ncbi:MAG: hypothetical protein LW860_05640, partial [Xanthomonadaceae bacterium]|nr:hypothetical protein [Xanthomonadaceae bacterium]
SAPAGAVAPRPATPAAAVAPVAAVAAVDRPQSAAPRSSVIPDLPPGIFDAPPARTSSAPRRDPAPSRAALPDPSPATAAVPVLAAPPGPLDASRWAELLAAAGLRGPLREFAFNVVPLGLEDGRLRLGIAASLEHLRSDAMLRGLGDALAPSLGAGLKVQVDVLDGAGETLAERERRERARRQADAESSLAADPVLQGLIQTFDGRVVPQSTRPSPTE